MKIQIKNEKEKNSKLANQLALENNKINILTNELNNEKYKTTNLSKENMILNKKLEELKSSIQQNNNQGAQNSINKDEIIELYKTISDLEKELYKQYPAFTESENIFLCKGTVINRYKTFESYKIKNGDILVLNKRD